MHIPDGYLSPQTYGPLYAVMTPIWGIAVRKVKATLKAKQVPLLALGAALCFVIMMFNVPIVGGSTGHAVGATIIAIVLGPWAAVIAVSLALIIQSLLFGDGGITAIGANSFNMAFLMPFVGYYVYRLLIGAATSERRKALSAGIAGYISLNVAALSAGIMFGIQPLIAHGADGRPLYAPYPLKVAIPAMAFGHLFFFGIVEAVATAFIVGYLSRMDASLVVAHPAARPLRWLWGGLVLLVLLTPLGALAAGTAWGEWNAAELKKTLGFVPAGLAHLEGIWKAFMPDYSTPGVANPLIGYLAAAIVGVGTVAVAAWLFGNIIAMKGEGDSCGSTSYFSTGRSTENILCDCGTTGRSRSLARRTTDAVTLAVAEVFADDEIALRDGALQKVDPRVKLAMLAMLAVTTSLVHSPLLLVLLYGAGVTLGMVSRVGTASLARRVWLSAGMFAAIIAIPAATSLITPGPALASLGPLSISKPGALGALTLILRVVASANFALLITLTTRWPDILRGLLALKVPDIFVTTLGMAQRYVISLLRAVEQLHLAKESRTIGRVSSRQERRWVTGRMAFVVKKSVKMGNDVYDAMLSRGYTGRTRSLSPLKARTLDLAWLTSATIFCVMLLLINYRVVL